MGEIGYAVRVMPPVADDEQLIRGTLRRLIDAGYGVIITTGGVGAEEKDLTVEAVLGLGGGAAVVDVTHYVPGEHRHTKRSVRLACASNSGTLLITLPGPNEEVRLCLRVLQELLPRGASPGEIAEALGQALRRFMRSKLRGEEE